MTTLTTEKAILLATTDTLPQPFTALGVVSATGVVRGVNNLRGIDEALAQAKAALATQAQMMGADAVIGIRVNFYQTSGVVLTGTAVRSS